MPFIAPATKVQANVTENTESREEKVRNDKRKLATSAAGVAINGIVALAADIIFISYSCTAARAALLSVTLGCCGTRLLHCLILALNVAFVTCSFLTRLSSEPHCTAMTIGITGITLLMYLPCCIAAAAILLHWHRDRGALT
uniref:G_PROTEIN_RECEP_F1_2 domain-containing protein n=1 Tax=Macrostomum lignano TaxID=282301 RepID=A0A1I8G810_9PLAT